MIAKIPLGPFAGYPDTFRTEANILIVEDPGGGLRATDDLSEVFSRRGIVLIGYAAACRIFVRLEDQFFMDSDGNVSDLMIKSCGAHRWIERPGGSSKCDRCSAILGRPVRW